jgi:hypothetical protein
VAKYKTRTPHTELTNYNWIRNLQQVNNLVQLEEFTMLFMTLSFVDLTDQWDTITWKWTASGKYMVSSAYECHFLGSMTNFPTPNIWKSFTEPRSKFYAWLVMHNRVLTTDNMIKKQ